MPSNRVTVRLAAPAAPILLLVHGVLSWFGGPAESAGRLAYIAAMVLFGVLAVSARHLVHPGAHPVAAGAVIATLAGVVCLLQAIIDLSPASPVPAFAGPLLFALGMLTLLGLLVAARRAPAWSPLLFGAGVAVLLIDDGALPFVALILLAALAPVGRPAAAPVPAVMAARLH